MKGMFTAPGGALAATVRFTAKWLDPKPSQPTHGGILVDATDGILSVTGFNENATARASLPIEGDASGQFVVAGRLIDQLVATFPDKPITFEQTDSLISVTAGKFTATMPAMSESDYPTLPDEAPIAGWVDGDEFTDAVQRVGVAASRDTSNAAKIALAGIHLGFPEEPGGPLVLTTTDSYRVARMSVDWEPDVDNAPFGKSVVVLASTLIDSAEVFESSRVRIGWRKGSFSLTTPDRSLVVRTIGSDHVAAGDAPIFHQNPQATAVVHAADVGLPLKRANLLNGRETESVWLDFRSGVLGFRVRTEVSGGDDSIEIEYDGPDCSTLVRSPFFRAALDSAPGGTAHLGITPGGGNRPPPIVFTSPADPAWVHILAVLRKS